MNDESRRPSYATLFGCAIAAAAIVMALARVQVRP
jgi:hypothetical protein